MNTNRSVSLVESLDDLLEQERQALLKGNLDAISAILSQKEATLNQFPSLKGSQTENLATLRAKVSRNQALLDSALRGIREVSDRMNALRRAQRSLETYDRGGNKSVVVTRPEHQVERRA